MCDMSQWLEIQGASLRYQFISPCARHQVAVLIHEIGGALESWDDVVPILSPHMALLRYDQRGFGMSEKAESLNLDQVCDDLLGLLDALEILQPVHLVGTALGGGIALAFALRHPTRVARIVAASPALGRAAGSDTSDLQTRATRVRAEGMRSITDTSLARSWPESLRVHDPLRFARYRLRWLSNAPQGLAAVSLLAGSFHLLPDLPRINAPTRILGCLHDSIITPTACREMADALPRAEYVEIDSGHFSSVQHPDRFAVPTLEFLRN